MRSSIVKNSALLAAMTWSAAAGANPRPLPFSYPYETLAKGEAEIEQYLDMTPSRALSATDGSPKWLALYRFQTAFEYGITDRLELGLYFQFTPRPGEGFTSVGTMAGGNAIKQRLRLRLAEEGQWPVDVSFYGEVVEAQEEIELEGRINLQRRFGGARIMANLWAEHEFYYSGKKEWVLNPTAGITYELTPAIHPGVEYWMRGEIDEGKLEANHYVGPAVMLNFGQIWWTSGAFLRVSDWSEPVQPGSAFGRFWFRSLIGIRL